MESTLAAEAFGRTTSKDKTWLLDQPHRDEKMEATTEDETVYTHRARSSSCNSRLPWLKLEKLVDIVPTGTRADVYAVAIGARCDVI